MRWKINLLCCLISILFFSEVHAQESLPERPDLKYPVFALKTNVLYDATSTLNLGVEFRLDAKKTLTIPVNYNPWIFSGNRRLKHLYVQPELRFWTCEVFNGFYWGLHAHAGQYNVGGIKLPFNMFPALESHRYQGHFYGAGLGLGYQWIINNRWNIELGIGAGYTRLEYDKYTCGRCGEKIKTDGRNYLGPDRIAVSLIYIIR